MPDKPLIGGSKWDIDGIQPAKAYWIEANAYREAISEYLSNPKMPREVRDDLLPLLTGLTDALLNLRHTLYELEIIGVQAKRDRLNGETS